MELRELKDRYVNPYTDFGFKKLFGLHRLRIQETVRLRDEQGLAHQLHQQPA